MKEPNQEQEKAKKERDFNQQQYDFLINCSKKGTEGIKEWNDWRDKNPMEEIKLQGAELKEAFLQDVRLWGAQLQKADLSHANLQGAMLQHANLEGAQFYGSNMQGVNLYCAEMQGADLSADLQGSRIWQAKLQWAKLFDANMQGAELCGSNIKGADFFTAKLQGADLRVVFADSSTNFFGCEIDEDTDFRGMVIENVCIASGKKTLLKYNIRRMNWRGWYAKHRFLQWPVKLFWSISNYGSSTSRIIVWFFGLALFFAAIYSNLACWWNIQVIGGTGEGIMVEPHLPLWHYYALVVLRPIYFSVVTMTTLGFGDMFANAQSIWGHILLMLQVILGYVLLGALVTRLAVLFTSDGPAGSFTPMEEETKELLAKLREDKGNTSE